MPLSYTQKPPISPSPLGKESLFFFKTQARNCGIFKQLIPNFFIAKRKQNKTVFSKQDKRCIFSSVKITSIQKQTRESLSLQTEWAVQERSVLWYALFYIQFSIFYVHWSQLEGKRYL